VVIREEGKERDVCEILLRFCHEYTQVDAYIQCLCHVRSGFRFASHVDPGFCRIVPLNL
jgi:hypothetical protein